jgi:hypothetical protein
MDGSVFVNSDIGVPQGGIVSPILSNIYLHPFDTFMENLIKEKSSAKHLISKVNPKIGNFNKRLSNLQRAYETTKDNTLKLDILKEIRLIRGERNRIPSRIRTGIRIHYVRYANDWLIGVLGPKSLCEELKQQCKEVLSTNLKLKLEINQITYIYSEYPQFLGFELHITRAKRAGKLVKKMVKGRFLHSRINKTANRRVAAIGDTIKFLIPIKKIFDKFLELGIIKKAPKSSIDVYKTNAITK